jgi:2-methylcitrate dehydratase PrpD
VVHPVIDGCLRIRADHEINPTDIDCVLLTVNPITLELAGRRAPKDNIEGHLSIYHWAAAALLTGKAGLAEARDRCICDPEIIALRGKVGALADATIEREAAKVTVVLSSGRTFHCDVSHSRGSAAQPMSDAELSQKFSDQAAGVLVQAQVSRLLELCWNVAAIEDVGEIARASTAIRRTAEVALA